MKRENWNLKSGSVKLDFKSRNVKKWSFKLKIENPKIPAENGNLKVGIANKNVKSYG